jgi:hypothetical protein
VCEELVRRALRRDRPDQDNVTVIGLGCPGWVPDQHTRGLWSAIRAAVRWRRR